MIDLAFLNHYAPLWMLVALFIIFYAAVKAMKVPGNNLVLAILSLLLSFIFVSSTRAMDFMLDIVPLFTVIMAVGFFILIILALIAKDLDAFKKPLGIAGCILAILIILSLAFSEFPTLHHLLPNSSDSGLNQGLVKLKDFIYSNNFIDTIVFTASIVLVCIFMIKVKKDK